MRTIILTFIFLILIGCGTISCIDSQFERKPVPIEGELVFQIQLTDGKKYQHQIKCERYYDSMCTERGNSWEIREVGYTSTYRGSSLPIKHASGEEYVLELPSCEKLIENSANVSLKNTHVVLARDKVQIDKTSLGKDSGPFVWIGKRYGYASSKNGKHTFKSGGYMREPLETLEFEFNLNLNGVNVSGEK